LPPMTGVPPDPSFYLELELFILYKVIMNSGYARGGWKARFPLTPHAGVIHKIAIIINSENNLNYHIICRLNDLHKMYSAIFRIKVV
jgi:hypothetical protein